MRLKQNQSTLLLPEILDKYLLFQLPTPFFPLFVTCHLQKFKIHFNGRIFQLDFFRHLFPYVQFFLKWNCTARFFNSFFIHFFQTVLSKVKNVKRPQNKYQLSRGHPASCYIIIPSPFYRVYVITKVRRKGTHNEILPYKCKSPSLSLSIQIKTKTYRAVLLYDNFYSLSHGTKE